jgi:hypothetical protein
LYRNKGQNDKTSGLFDGVSPIPRTTGDILLPANEPGGNSELKPGVGNWAIRLPEGIVVIGVGHVGVGVREIMYVVVAVEVGNPPSTVETVL